MLKLNAAPRAQAVKRPARDAKKGWYQDKRGRWHRVDMALFVVRRDGTLRPKRSADFRRDRTGVWQPKEPARFVKDANGVWHLPARALPVDGAKVDQVPQAFTSAALVPSIPVIGG